MKTIINLIIVMLVCVTNLNAGNNVTKPKYKDPYHLEVEGQILSGKNIHFTVYRMAKDGIFKVEERGKVKKFYHYMCDRGSKYIFRFENKKGDVKFLMVDATDAGYFGVNVDFSKPYDGKIYPTKNGYDLLVLTNLAPRPDDLVRH